MCVRVEKRELVGENEWKREKKYTKNRVRNCFSFILRVCVHPFSRYVSLFLRFIIEIMTSNYVNVKRWMLDTAINRFKDKWTFFLLSFFLCLPRDNNQFFLPRHNTSVFGGVEYEWKCLVNLFPVNNSIDLIYLIIAYWFQVSFWKSYGNEIHAKKKYGWNLRVQSVFFGETRAPSTWNFFYSFGLWVRACREFHVALHHHFVKLHQLNILCLFLCCEFLFFIEKEK